MLVVEFIYLVVEFVARPGLGVQLVLLFCKTCFKGFVGFVHDSNLLYERGTALASISGIGQVDVVKERNSMGCLLLLLLGL